MSNLWYTPGNVPVTQSRGSSATIRAEYAALQAAFDKLPTPAQTWGGSQSFASAGGSVNAWTATIAATYLTGYVDGLQVRVKFPAANTTGTPTLNLNALGAVQIVSEGGGALSAGDILAGSVVTLAYNATFGKWQISLGNSVSSAQAAATAAGISAGQGSTSAAAAAASAAAANSSAGTAATAAANAITAQTLAEAARDLALAGSKTFTTTAQGLAATTTGQMFLLRTADLYTYDVYYNNTGVAALLGQVNIASGTLYGSDTGSLALMVWADSAGKVLAALKNDGLHMLVTGTDVLLTGAPDELQTTTSASLSSVEDTNNRKLALLTSDARLQLIGFGDVLDQVASASFVTGLEYTSFGDTAKASFFYDKSKSELKQRVNINKIACFFNEDSGTSFARMPSVLPLTATTGLIFFTQRKSFYSTGEDAQHSVCKTYSFDLTAKTITFGSTVTVYQRAEWGNATPGGWAVNPIAFVESASGSHPGRIHCLINTFDSTAGLLADRPSDYYIVDTYSDDNGATWSVPSKILGKAQVFNTLTGGTGGITGAVSSTIFGVITGTGNSLITLTKAPYAGRIVVAINGLNDTTARWWQGCMYSDNQGTTWTRGTLSYYAVAPHQFNEAQIVERSDGVLLRLMRDEVNDGVTYTLQRGMQTSSDGGATWSAESINTSAAFNACSGSLVNSSYAATSGFSKIISGSAAQSTYAKRTKHRMRLSYDNGTTFIAEAAFFGDVQQVGYEHLVRLSSGYYLLAYETGNTVNVNESVGLMVFNEAELFARAALS